MIPALPLPVLNGKTQARIMVLRTLSWSFFWSVGHRERLLFTGITRPLKEGLLEEEPTLNLLSPEG